MGFEGSEPGGSKNPEYLSTLERGLRVLKAFDEDHPEMTLSEVAARTGLPPAVARRCLITLVDLGYIGQHDRRFLLRPAVLTIGSAFLASMQIEQVVLPPLQHLRDQTGDSASLAVLSGSDILYVAHVSTDRRFRVAAGVARAFPSTPPRWARPWPRTCPLPSGRPCFPARPSRASPSAP